MNEKRFPLSKVAGAAIIVLIAAVLIWSVSTPARAAMGNNGVPVRCFANQLKPAEPQFLKCQAADGTAFTDNERVPDGYYLLVTDILVVPDAGTDTTGIVSIVVYDSYGTDSIASSLTMRSGSMDGFGYHFTTPYFVLEAGHRLEASPWWFNTEWADMHVSGILTNNVTYMPVAAGGS